MSKNAYKLSVHQYATRYELDEHTVRRWQKRGLPLDDERLMSEYRSRRGHKRLEPEPNLCQSKALKVAQFAPPPERVERDTELLNRLDYAQLAFRCAMMANKQNHNAAKNESFGLPI